MNEYNPFKIKPARRTKSIFFFKCVICGIEIITHSPTPRKYCSTSCARISQELRRQEAKSFPSWTCDNCGEKIELDFEITHGKGRAKLKDLKNKHYKLCQK